MTNDPLKGRHGVVGVIANPMAGRDVRRLAARASEVTHQAKRDAVARIAAGADAAGIARLLVHAEPFRISTGAVESMDLVAEVQVLDGGVVENGEADTARAVAAMRAAGVDVIVVLGGDGTSRCVARAWSDAPIVAVSTGTNNVFPTMVEPTLAGAAAGLVATGAVALEAVSRRAKVMHVRAGDSETIALVDTVLLRDDFVGNRRPFDPLRIEEILLTIAAPASVGISPIGGLLDPVDAALDAGLHVRCNGGAGDRSINVPISPGLYRTVRVAGTERVALDAPLRFSGPGVIALDGDREVSLGDGEVAEVVVRRSGPPVIDVSAALAHAVAAQTFG